jgi:hypothetical protein
LRSEHIDASLSQLAADLAVFRRSSKKSGEARAGDHASNRGRFSLPVPRKVVDRPVTTLR